MAPEPIPYAELIGALGDLIWAAHVNAKTPRGEPLVEILGLAEDHELILQRLLLSGYRKESDSEGQEVVWSRPEKGRLLLLEGSGTWIRDALMAATRNRDRLGAPHLTAPFAILQQLIRRQTNGEELVHLIRAASDQLAEVASIVECHAPDSSKILTDLIRQANLAE